MFRWNPGRFKKYINPHRQWIRKGTPSLGGSGSGGSWY